MLRSEKGIQLFPEDTGIKELPIIGKSISNTAYTGLSRHHHDGCMEIVYLHKGEQIYRVNDSEEYSLTGGEVFFTLPYEWHDTAQLPQSRSVLYWLHLEIFNMESERIKILGLPEDQSFALAKELLSLKTRKFKAGNIIKTYFDRLLKTPPDKSPLGRCRIENTVISLLFEVAEMSKKAAKLNISEDIQYILDYIDANLTSQLTVSRLAGLINLSEPRFKQKFKAQAGSPPIDYIQNRRVEKAKELLISSDSVTEVAFNLGFNTSQYFSEVFKKYTGMTPRDYKKTNR